MEMHQQTLTDFNQAVRLPRQITPAIFSTMVRVATDCIERAIGEDAPLAQYLRREPPIPMQDRGAWNRLYGRIVSSINPDEQGPTELRPDLVFHPVFMISVIAHEGAHAIDPRVREATQFAQWFEAVTQDHPDYGMNSLLWAEMENDIEINALLSEKNVLSKLRAPEFLASAQIEYFNEQQPVLLAFRTI